MITPIAIVSFLVISILLPRDAFAWGISSHLAIAGKVAGSMASEGPYSYAAAIFKNYGAFMAGNIVPDIFAIRNCFRKPSYFVHSWALARKLIESAENDTELAFALGHATHLSSDVICHNFFIPKYIFARDIGLTLTHLLAETHVDGYIGGTGSIKEIEEAFEESERLRNFFMMHCGVSEKEFSLNIRMMKRSILFKIKSGLDSFAHNSGKKFFADRSRIDEHLEHSAALAVKALKEPPVTLPVQYCPLGDKRIMISRIRRRIVLRQLSEKALKQGVTEGWFDYLHRVPPGLAGA